MLATKLRSLEEQQVFSTGGLFLQSLLFIFKGPIAFIKKHKPPEKKNTENCTGVNYLSFYFIMYLLSAFFFFFETGSYVAQAGLELMVIPLPQPSKC